ncbi:MAG TPA: glycosyltransferase [Rhabdochlamydiaceae bacterium]|nr:glycosyltransferase [Rhabdochlamydiaceae bacterium]
MIVKNDEEFIENCLNSVKEIVDCLSISDLGSKDNTVQIIKQFMERTGIPGKVTHHEWKNFGYNRTAALQASQKTLRELGIPLKEAYFLVMDPEMILTVGAGFKKEELDDDGYLLLHKSSPFSNYALSLLSAALPWESLGAAQEFWSCKVPHTSKKLSTLSIIDQASQQHKEAKSELSIPLLKKALKSDPENNRYFFGLGGSYQSLKQYEEAIKWYKKFLLGEGERKEEVWFAKYMVGECYEALDLWDQALKFYLDAYQHLPQRPDSLRKIASYYRLQGQNDLAYLFAQHAARIKSNEEPELFISDSVHYEINEELSIAAYYTPFKETGYLATDELLLQKNLPWFHKSQAARNLIFYTEKIKGAEFKKVEVNLPRIREDLSLYYNPMNPSIYRTNWGYKFICRTVNFTLKNGNYRSLDSNDPENTIRTRNFLIDYDKDFHLLEQKEIIEVLPRIKIPPAWSIEGLEDCRLFSFQGSDWFTCTTFDTNPSGACQISLCKLEDEKKDAMAQIEKFIPLKGPDPNRYEKNWLPFVKDDQLFAIYSYDPLIINKPNIESGEWEEFFCYTPEYDFSRFRGSAGPIALEDGYLALVHEVVMLSDIERCYLHRFIYFNKNFIITKVSLPFTFQHLGVEYCCSMTLDHTGTKLVMPIGIEDKEAYLCIVDLVSVLDSLRML